ncbi:MAG: DegQ family serine endoprotease [Alphaproteobacteria bacterium]
MIVKKTHIAIALCASILITTYSIHISAAKTDSSATKQRVLMVPSSFADLAETLSPSVVNISSTQKVVVPQDFPDMPQFPEGSPFEDFFRDFMERRGGGMPPVPTASMGSGFIIDAQNGYVITNNHVVRDAEDIQVTLNDDTTLSAEIIGTDDKIDIAVLQIDPQQTKNIELKAVSFGDSDTLRVGDWTLAIGNPFGLGGSVTAGIVSARARNIHSGPYDDYIQTDASINRGNSGGPLFNLKGEVIGINTAIFSPTGGSIGIGFSIPSALAEPVIKQIIKYGRTRRGWLGVRIQHVTEDIAETLGLGEPRGAMVSSVNEQGPAKESGLQAGDIILEVNEQQISEMRFLPRIIAEYDVGSKARITYWRDGKEQKTTVTIGELEKAEDEGLIASASPESTEGSTGQKIEMMGFTLKALDDSLRSIYNLPANTKGVLITDVEPMSEAQKKGLMAGDIIVEINQQPVSQTAEIAEIIEKAEASKRKSVLLLINTQGNMRFVALRITKDE